MSAPENSVSLGGVGRSVPCKPAVFHIQSKFGALLSFSISATASIYAVNCHRLSPELIRSRTYLSMAFTAESPPAEGYYSGSQNAGTFNML